MEGRNGCDKFFNRDAKFFQISLTNCPQFNSHTHFHFRRHTTFPSPSLEAYLFIFQVHDFLPNYLSSTHQSRSTMQFKSLTVTPGLGCSRALSLCLHAKRTIALSFLCPHNKVRLEGEIWARTFTRNVGGSGREGRTEPSIDFISCTHPGISSTTCFSYWEAKRGLK